MHILHKRENGHVLPPLYLVVALAALRAFTLDHKRKRMGMEALGQRDIVDMHMIETERPLARLAVKMHMTVFHVARPLAQA